MRIIRPKYDVSEDDLKKLPLFYLIGPVLGGGDWQANMCLVIGRHIGDCHIAVPCRWEGGGQLPLHMDRSHSISSHFVGVKGSYERQLHWEHKYIDLALTSRRSGVICWLSEESKVNPRERSRGPYGQDSYGEMGCFRGLLRYDRGLRLVVGAEPGFPGLSAIKENFNYYNREPFPFEETMLAVVLAAKEKFLKA